MMKMPLAATAGLLALLLPSHGQAAPTPATPRILVTLRGLEIPGNTPIRLGRGPDPARGVYDTLLQNVGNEAIEVSVLTPGDFTGMASYNRIVPSTIPQHGASIRVFPTAPTSLEATPHMNSDGTITVKLKTEVSQAPSTAIQSITATRTFKSGETLLLGSRSGAEMADKQRATPGASAVLQFVTVTVLPGEVAAR